MLIQNTHNNHMHSDSKELVKFLVETFFLSGSMFLIKQPSFFL